MAIYIHRRWNTDVDGQRKVNVLKDDDVKLLISSIDHLVKDLNAFIGLPVRMATLAKLARIRAILNEI